MHRRLAPLVVTVALVTTSFLAPAATLARQPGVLRHIDHLVVIYLENRSFDNLYGWFAGANGITNASVTSLTQLNGPGGAPYSPCLPQVDPHLASVCVPDGSTFDIGAHIPATSPTIDLVHRFYQNQVQIDGGRNDLYTWASDAKGLTMGNYDTAALPLANLAAHFTLADNFFQAAFGGSFLNHQWLAAAQTPVFDYGYSGRPTTCTATFGANYMNTVLDTTTGMPVAGKDLQLTTVATGNYDVNTTQPWYAPYAAGTSDCGRLQPLTENNIGDELSAEHVSWAWYAGGWNAAQAGTPDPLFQYHHQPFNYFYNYRPGTAARAQHLKDETDFMTAAQSGSLPAVSFVKPIGANNEHPGYADLMTGELHTLALVNAVMSGPDWKNTAIVITYDEMGGFWDHAAPPVVDQWGPGTRIPAIIVSPWAKKGFVDHTRYDTTSILATIEHRWDLDPLGPRDRNANDLRNAFLGDGPGSGRGGD
ncbi:MAG: acid phosphatase [Acidimicrobiales bacterium]